MDRHHSKVFFTELEKLFIISLRDTGRYDLRTYFMYIDKIMDDAPDISTILDLIEKQEVRS